ncbi:hypothetical protein LAZ67_2003785 [Cordylochernes scorpioides]|uniref:CCHC-type domain-containing protein n=1 Tax=Cordylochernes scorpioides TaxID=51811 RepID=A0ABY6K4X1_9ARAC|nr:hypothetical protein LAZ67_2003785 [Cordylochernes scorpioides]
MVHRGRTKARQTSVLLPASVDLKALPPSILLSPHCPLRGSTQTAANSRIVLISRSCLEFVPLSTSANRLSIHHPFLLAPSSSTMPRSHPDRNKRYHGLLLEDETITEVKIEEEFEGCENYVQGMFDIENKYLSRCETARDRVDGSLVESAANSVVNTESKRNIRLPKVELPKFKGNLEDWLSWWGQFSKINDDETLGDVDKFHYLLQAVVEGSRAQRLVCSYPITEDNYPKVVQALKDRFGDKNLLIEHYIRRLLKLVVSNARKENLPLDEIYDDLTAHLKNLESLGVNTEMAGVFLYPLVESSLPLDIIQVWQRNPAVGYGIKEVGAENGDKSDASGRLQALMDFLRDEVKGAERMAFAKENFEGNSSMRATGSQLKTPRKTPPTVSSLFGSAFKRKCIFCQRDNHLSSGCFVASRLTPSERDQRIKEARVCFKCLKGNHLKRECRADIKCRNCGKDHLDIFCNKIALKQGGNNSFKGETSKVVNEGNATCTGVNMSARTCANDILLMTSVAKLKGAKETKEVKVLFDTGSHYSYIKRSIVEKLGLNKIGEISLEKSLFGGGNMKEALHGKYVLKLGSLTNKIDVDIVALDQPEICARIPPIPRGRLLYKLKRKKIYIHPSNFRNEEIDILIGSDYFGQLLTGKVVHLGEDLTAVETKLGWTLMGQSPVVCKEDKVQIALNMLVARNNLKDLWELDVLGIQDPIEVVSKKKRETELREHFIKNIKRDEDQRYSVALPWKCERNNIPSNLEIAQRRLEACTKWEREGLIERIEENRPQKKGHYLPHRPVFKAESRTTPLRPVFDASCRSYNGLSLNDYLEKGPNLLEKIPEILIRFREKGIGVLADIRKAFQMITVQLQDQDFLRFLWWDQTDPMKLTVFRHKRVVFGLNCSPFILGAVIDHHLNSVQGPAAEIAKTMARSFYMDNLVTSLSSQEEVQQFQNTAVNIMEMAKMDLRMPPHRYNLKVGAIVMLLKYLNPKQGLCNGTNINLPFILMRCQFSLVLAFAMTIYKAQGQTFARAPVAFLCSSSLQASRRRPENHLSSETPFLWQYLSALPLMEGHERLTRKAAGKMMAMARVTTKGGTETLNTDFIVIHY